MQNAAISDHISKLGIDRRPSVGDTITPNEAKKATPQATNTSSIDETDRTNAEATPMIEPIDSPRNQLGQREVAKGNKDENKMEDASLLKQLQVLCALAAKAMRDEK